MSSGHWLIVGMTESGKSTLARSLAREYAAGGHVPIVLDVTRNREWGSTAIIFDDPDALLAYVRDPEKCLRQPIFVEEAGLSIGKYQSQFQWLTTFSRHHGMRCHIVAQRAEMVDKTTRSQCTNLAAFGLSFDDAKAYAREFNGPEIMQCVSFKPGTYIHKTRYAPGVVRKVF
jgi:ABC-type glutathione transport system ATPase component